MKNKYRRLQSGFTKYLQVGAATALAVMLLVLPVASNAQETRSEIRGSLTGPDGSPAGGVTVQITDSRTGRSNSTTSAATGRFLIGNLNAGGPYTVTIMSEAYANQTITDVNLALGKTLDLDLQLGAATMDEITVTAAAVQTAQVAVGPSSSFDFDQLQNTPSINRDLKDVIRIDPRVYIDEADVNGIQCIGANPRFNSMTIDGVKQNDNFGLNRSGYPTERMPFPFDAIQNVSLELSPYDVEYGGFTACNINAVTRSGTNEFHGRAWYTYGDADLRGDKLEDDKLPPVKFDEKRFGASLGGPIIEDTLFFFVAYEKWEGANLFDRCAGDQSCGRPVLGVSEAQLERIAQIAQTNYGFDPGEAGLASLPNEDEKYLIKLDWNINDRHNAALTHVYNDGFNMTGSDRDADEFEFSNHFYERGAELTSTTVQWFADWSDVFNTEVRVGFANLDNRQNSLGLGFGEMQIETYFDGDNDGSLDRALVYLGGDDSRQANDLEYDTFNFKLAANWHVGDHVISAGLEQEELDIFNVFVQHSVGGEYRFDENRTDLAGNPVGCSSRAPWTTDGCIDQFEAFSPDDVYYGNTPSLDPNDASAEFKHAVNTFYLQDEFTIADGDVTIVAGLRYDWYTSDDLPRANDRFEMRTGFTNAKNFDGESLLQPRLGITWDVTDRLTLRGGVGLYSGGNPNVWLSNNYSNDGFTAIQVREGDCPDMQVGDCIEDMNITPGQGLNTIPLGVDGNGRPGYDAPQALINHVQGGTANAGVNGIDPGFSIPSNWKFSLGATWEFDMGALGDDYVLNADVIFTDSKDSAFIRDDTYVQYGTAPDGRPIYTAADKEIPGCATDPTADFGTWIGCDRLFTGDYILDNIKGPDAEQFNVSFLLEKDHDFGLSWAVGYAFTESNDNAPMTSSVAFSNWFLLAIDDYNDPRLATSNYEIPHRFIFNLSYANEFFGDLTTRFSLFGSRSQGRPYSATFAEQEMFFCGPFFCPSDDRSLLYMPDGPSDPNVIFDPGFDQDAFFSWAKKNGLNKYGGRIVRRNSLESSWWSKVDLRISQDLPGFSDTHRAQLYFTINNFLNFLNNDWGILKERSFPRQASVVEASLVDVNGTPDVFEDDVYSFDSFFKQGVSRVTRASVWSMRFGFNYRF